VLVGRARAHRALQHNQCGHFETQYWKCVGAFGAKLGKKYCQLEARDFTECVFANKSLARIEAMRKIRYEQYLKGRQWRRAVVYRTYAQVSARIPSTCRAHLY
jgi:hypothetical protein